MKSWREWYETAWYSVKDIQNEIIVHGFFILADRYMKGQDPKFSLLSERDLTTWEGTNKI